LELHKTADERPNLIEVLLDVGAEDVAGSPAWGGRRCRIERYQSSRKAREVLMGKVVVPQ
jgi:hypothetical protein